MNHQWKFDRFTTRARAYCCRYQQRPSPENEESAQSHCRLNQLIPSLLLLTFRQRTRDKES